MTIIESNKKYVKVTQRSVIDYFLLFYLIFAVMILSFLESGEFLLNTFWICSTNFLGLKAANGLFDLARLAWILVCKTWLLVRRGLGVLN